MAITDITVNELVDSDGNVVDGSPPFEYLEGKTVFLSVTVTYDSGGVFIVEALVGGEPRGSEEFGRFGSGKETIDIPFSSSSIAVGGFSIFARNENGSVTSNQFELNVFQPDIESISNLNIDGQGSTATIAEGNDVPIAFDVDVNTSSSYSFTAETGEGIEIGKTSLFLSTGVQTVTISSSDSNTSTLSPGTFTVTVSEADNPASIKSTDGLTVKTQGTQLSVSGGSDADVGGSLSISLVSGIPVSVTADDADTASVLVSKQTQTADIESLSGLNIDGQGSSATITESNDVPIAFDVDVNTADTYSFTAETGGGTSIGSTSASLSTGLQTVTIGSVGSNTSALSPATFTVTVSNGGNTASVTSTDGLTVQPATGAVAGQWTIAGERLDYVSERRTAREIEWGFRVGQTELVALQPLLDAAGKVSLVERIDGGFEAVDRANGDATFAGLAPTERASVRPVDTWLIREYDVEYLSSDGQEQFVTIVAAPIREKTGASSNPFSTIGTPTRLTNDPNQWFFEFEYGDILTSQVTSNLTSANDAQVQVYSIELIVSPVEVRRIEESCGKSGAVTVREIVDGANFPVVDTTGANRVTITPPTSAQDDVAVGEYGVLGWETSFNRNVYRVNMEVVKL